MSSSKASSTVRWNGKTIQSVDTSACNCWTFYFTDGSSYDLEVEGMGLGLYGIMARKVPNNKIPPPPKKGMEWCKLHKVWFDPKLGRPRGIGPRVSGPGGIPG